MLTDIKPKIQQRLGLSLTEITDFSQQWQIAEMALFGSVLRDEFRADSDIELSISFLPNARQGLLILAKIKHELEKRLRRQVDIVVKQSVETSENWIRQNEIMQTASPNYTFPNLPFLISLSRISITHQQSVTHIKINKILSEYK